MLNQSHVNNMMEILAESYTDSYTKMFPVKKAYIYALRKSVVVGDTVAIGSDNIIYPTEYTTHEIMALNGTLAGNVLKMEVKDLITEQIKTIDL